VKVVDKAGKTVALADVLTKAGPNAPVAVKSGEFHILIGRPYSIDNEERPFELHGPGEPLDGALSNLSPFPRP
jgi:hypothetical protein